MSILSFLRRWTNEEPTAVPLEPPKSAPGFVRSPSQHKVQAAVVRKNLNAASKTLGRDSPKGQASVIAAMRTGKFSFAELTAMREKCEEEDQAVASE